MDQMFSSTPPRRKGPGHPTPTTRTLGRDDWVTPPEIFAPLDANFGGYALDAAASDASASRCLRFITPEEDALVFPWADRLPRESWNDGQTPAVWNNPPYKLAAKFLARASEQAIEGRLVATVLVFANVDTNYWNQHVVRAPNVVGVLFMHKRVRFILPGEGESRAGAPKGSALVIYGPRTRKGALPHAYWTHRDATGRKTPGEPVLPILAPMFAHY